MAIAYDSNEQRKADRRATRATPKQTKAPDLQGLIRDLFQQANKVMAPQTQRLDPIEMMAQELNKVGVSNVSGRARGAAPQQSVLPPVDNYAAFDEWLSKLPAIEKGDYTAPFDQAAATARAAADAARPAITSAYDDLRNQLTSGQTDFDQQAAAQRAALEQRLGTEQGRVNSLVDPGIQALLDQGVDPGMVAQARQAVDMLRGDAAAADSRTLGLQDRMAEVQRMSSEGRVQDAGGAEAAALANTSNNLGELLQQIGLKRADAEGQYQGDVAKRDLEVYQARQSYEADLREQERAAAEQSRKDAEERIKQIDKQQKDKEASYTTPREDFLSTWGERAQMYPKATDLFQELLTDAGDKGEMSKAKARRLITDNAESLANGTFGEGTEQGPIGFAADVQTLLQWVEEYYDDKTKRPPRSPGRM